MHLRRPSAARLQRFLEIQSKFDFTYPAVGATATVPPAGERVDHTRLQLGQGEPLFQAAKAALARWKQFRLGWLEVWPPDAPIRPGQTVAVVARLLGLWWLNACRIVYVVDEERQTRRFGFAYGTLPAHAGRGEERFLIEWDRQTNAVWYDVLAFSRPNQFVTRIGYPYMRRVQRGFGPASAAALLRGIAGNGG